MLETIRQVLLSSDSGVDFEVGFVGDNITRKIRLLSADEIGIAFMRQPPGKQVTLVAWHQIDNLRFALPE